MKNILIAFIISLSLFSCSDDILDINPTDRVAATSVWSDPSLIMAYHNTLYTGIGTGNSRNMLAKATDEMAYKPNARYPGPILDGTLNSENVTNRVNFGGSGTIYTWNLDFSLIRKINVFLEQMEGNDALEISLKNRLVAEAKFIRAYMYFKLIVRFGGVPIIDEVSTQETLAEELIRNSFDECVAFIEADLDAALPDLDEAYHPGDGDFGRATQAVCKALRSRMYLYLASPLFNTDNDVSKWQDAADAALDLIDDGNFSLHPDYKTLFNAPTGSANNEIIFARNYTASNSHDHPMIYVGRRYGGFGGWSADGGIAQNLVDDYDMLNGEPAYLKVNHVNTTINPASGYDPQNPYANRDPRLDYSINHDESEFRGSTLEMWVSEDGNTWGFDSYKESNDNPEASTFLRKFITEDESIVMDFSTPFTTPFIWFRLGEIYLNYAEAAFELGDEATCRQYINLIRARATVEMPPIPDSVTGEELRTRLYNERRIELAFEEHRYFDVRRWEIAPFTQGQPSKGMHVFLDQSTGVKRYEPYVVNPTVWDDKLYFIPIENAEVLRSGGTLTQTPGY
ncbi:MAG: RagB/SusD family nutrient uptake outer membrane protein [Maribacter stanieri]